MGPTPSPTPKPTPSPTPEPTPLPTPSPTCERDTGADCSWGGCFQHTRGNTTCDPFTKRCHCFDELDCLYTVNVSMSQPWHICRRDLQTAVADAQTTRWAQLLAMDIVEAYKSIFNTAWEKVT